MKSVIVRDCNGKVLLHVVDNGCGKFSAKVDNQITKLVSIRVVTDTNERVTLREAGR